MKHRLIQPASFSLVHSGTIPCMAAQTAPISTYGRVLGFAYQVLGDVALAMAVADEVYLRHGEADDVVLWQATVRMLDRSLAHDIAIEPLAPEGQHAALLTALQQLTHADRMLILLRYHERLALPQLATVLHDDPRRVRLALIAARQRLLRLLRGSHAL